MKKKVLQCFFDTKNVFQFPFPLLEGFLSSDGFKNGNLYGDDTSESTETAAGQKATLLMVRKTDTWIFKRFN